MWNGIRSDRRGAWLSNNMLHGCVEQGKSNIIQVNCSPYLRRGRREALHHSKSRDLMDVQRLSPSLEIGCFFSVSHPIACASDTASGVTSDILPCYASVPGRLEGTPHNHWPEKHKV